jgi:predicted HD phosphohydrolase
MKEVSAVEWLLEQLPTIDKYDPYYLDIITQAKEMEKQQQGYSEEEVIEIIKLSCEEGMLIQRTINDKVKIPYMRIKDFTIRMFEQYKKK